MTRLGGFVRRHQPLLGLLLIATGWAASHQVGSEAVFDGCGNRGGGFVALVSVLGLLAVASGGLLGLGARSQSQDNGRGTFGLVVALLALLAGFAVVLQIIAALLLPPCFA